MADIDETRTKPTSLGYDDFLEDIFGLNIRGLKTLFVCVTSPKTYFEAAHHVDWREYTPSFRLWLSLIAIIFVLEFFWAGSNSPLIASYASQLQSQGVVLPETVSYERAARTYANWYFGLLPPVAVIANLIAAITAFGWGKKLNYIGRQRYVFVALVPDAGLSILTISALAIIPAGMIMHAIYVLPLVSFLAIAITIFFGAITAIPIASRLLRSAWIGFYLVVVSQLASFAAMYGAALIIQMKFG